MPVVVTVGWRDDLLAAPIPTPMQQQIQKGTVASSIVTMQHTIMLTTITATIAVANPK